MPSPQDALVSDGVGAPRSRGVSWDDGYGCSGPEAGAGPLPQSPRAEEEEGFMSPVIVEPNLDLDVSMFASLAAEEFTPLQILHTGSVASEGSSKFTPRPQDGSIRNLDTGEERRLGEGALTQSFLKGEYVAPGALSNKRPHWVGWRAEKRANEESLWFAAESGSINKLREALTISEDASTPKASVNAPSLYGRTALHMAASAGKPEGIELLLDVGADFDARTDAGLTPLHVASQRGHPSVVALLLDWGAESSPETNDRNLPLHFAAAGGHTDVVTLLLERGGADQLVVRNSMARRAAEMSLDIHTANAFKEYENKMPVNLARGPASIDTYAGRTPFGKGEVLLHNSRADVVFRTLNKTQGTTFADMIAATAEFQKPMGRQSGKSTRGSQDSGRVRGPFARVREDIVAVEKVGPESFQLLDRLGKGSFGEVFQVKHKQTDGVYAMKILLKSKIMSGNLLRYAVTERNVLSYITHPYMVSLHYAFQTRTYLVLVLHYCPGGNLQALIERERRLKGNLAQLYTAELLLALSYLHERQIVFRDLKPDNVVIDEVGHCMLTDFGLSKEGVTALHGTKSFCGSVAFLAPEILSRKGHTHTVDIYGLGVLLFDMLTGLPPFYHPQREKLYQNIKHAKLMVPSFVSKSSSSLIYDLMNREPTKRLGAIDTKDVMKHEYFSDMDFEALQRREVPVPASFNNAPGTKSWSQPADPFKERGAAGRPDVNGWSFAS